MSTALFLGYDKAGLDREYDNRRKVSDAEYSAYVRHFEVESEKARATLPCVLDVPYGASAMERLDIFRADKPNAPVHVFFHGGYWRAGDKKEFDYVALGLVPHGVTTVVVNYALMPSVDMDELVDQCRRSLAWVKAHIAGYGGDPDQVSMSGHSAGGQIVAMMMAADWPKDAGRFTYACAISGIYELEPIRHCFLNDILDLDAGEIGRNSPRFLPRRVWCPLTIAVGEREGVEYLRQTRDFAEAWTGPADRPRVVVTPNDDHFSIRAKLGDPGSEMVAMVLGRDKP